MVPRNTGTDDTEAAGEVLEFDLKHGPGTSLAAGEVEEIKSQVQPKITRRAHLKKADFEKHRFTDRCGGWPAFARGLHIQPHTDPCRRRLGGVKRIGDRVEETIQSARGRGGGHGRGGYREAGD